MQGVLPAQSDKYFPVKGFKFHVGVSGNESDETLQLSLVREKVAGGGNYAVSNTWQFFYNMDLSLFMFQFKDRGMTREEILNAAFADFTKNANEKLAEFTGGTTQPPTMPTDLFQQVKWIIENKLSFRLENNQLVYIEI